MHAVLSYYNKNNSLSSHDTRCKVHCIMIDYVMYSALCCDGLLGKQALQFRINYMMYISTVSGINIAFTCLIAIHYIDCL